MDTGNRNTSTPHFRIHTTLASENLEVCQRLLSSGESADRLNGAVASKAGMNSISSSFACQASLVNRL